ncbi:helix-turn-helix domain-containing protein [Bacillus sp. FJAT-49736]|uniref:response regulator transcription factor n=1 Tax=Bacillus sp. FJAT-49736 TaxID=2833582 RepID=UPI001BCA63A1|nr:helix-turn-helix domain-containing protein [Bacillus sp. FJAT-49736]MBS4174825.1 helix-turn-helix domain-containing protein [Bacillus sp. FJAT-49736]MBS4175518.1 helix-turn-helix domain-containing protein [Bacillus sp. FJAT-49736]
MKILIVDDEQLELEQLHFLIHERYPSWSVIKVEDAAQAKRVLENQSIDLALLDIHLPGESGLDLCLYIREHYETECMMITAYETFQYAKQAIRLHVFDYIVKPVISKEFYQALDRFKEQFGYLEKVSPVVQQVLNIIHKNYGSKLNLKDLSEEVHMSPTYLSRKFSEELGMSFQEYLVSLRIEKAKKHLKEHPDWTIQKISEEVGFTSLHHFSSTFKKMVLLSPRQYKESFSHD